jgi:hypothetical protein
MNYLSLCKRLAAEAQIAGTVASVTGQSGIMASVVDWIASADRRIQLEHPNWAFRWGQFDFETTAGTRDYDLSDLSIERVVQDSVTAHDGDESAAWSVCSLSYQKWRDQYGTSAQASGRPQYITPLPSNALRITPTPDAAYTLQGDFYKKVVSLVNNADEPIYPEQFHMLPVWRALMDWGGYFNAPEAVQRGAAEYRLLLGQMERDQLPPLNLSLPTL